MRVKVLMAAPWKWEVMVLEGGAPADAAAYIRTMAGINNADIEPYAAGHAWVHMSKPAVIWVATLDDIPCLVHEFIHAVFGMLNARGLKHCEDSEEAFTYTVEDLLRRTLDSEGWAEATLEAA